MTISQTPIRDMRTAEPFRSLFPRSEAMVTAIADAMRDKGFDPAFPIVSWDGVVVDGHTRLAAAKAAKLGKVWYVNHPFTSEGEALEYAIRCQTNRRNLTEAEILRCVAEVDKRKTRAEATAVARDAKADPPSGGTEGATAAATAALLGISQRKVERARTIIDHAPEPVRAAVKSGDLSINAAYRATQDARRAETAPEQEEAPAKSFEPVPVNPCPYCHRQSPAIDRNGPGNVYFVRCDGCQMTGPAAGDEADAAEKWNSLPPREVTR